MSSTVAGIGIASEIKKTLNIERLLARSLTFISAAPSPPDFAFLPRKKAPLHAVRTIIGTKSQATRSLG